MMKAKRFLLPLLFVLLFAGLFSALSRVLVPARGSEKYYPEAVMQAEYEALPKQSVDVLVMGSSTVLVGIFPQQLWQDYGIAAYNYAGTQQESVILYYSLMYALRNQSPQVILLDARPLTKNFFLSNEETFEGAARRKMDNMKFSRAKVLAALDFASLSDQQSALSYLFPLLRYHSRWNALSPEDFEPDTRLRGNPPLLGARYYTQVEAVQPTRDYEDLPLREDSSYAVLDSDTEAYYTKIVELAHQHGAEVVLVMMPRAGQFWRPAWVNAMRRFCEKNNIPWINFNSASTREETALDYQTDFYNRGHLNVQGGAKITAYLGEYLTAHFPALQDHRGQEGYGPWQAASY